MMRPAHPPRLWPHAVAGLALTTAALGAPPAAWWSFDDDSARETISGRLDPITGHAAFVDGVRGRALRSDEFSTAIECPAADAPRLGAEGFTVEAWIAPRAFPWNYCPLLRQHDDTRGWSLNLDYQGRIVFRVATNTADFGDARPAPSARLALTFSASADHPLVRPGLVIRNWGDTGCAVTRDGIPLVADRDFRIGKIPTPTGTDLIVWLDLSSESPLGLVLTPP